MNESMPPSPNIKLSSVEVAVFGIKSAGWDDLQTHIEATRTQGNIDEAREHLEKEVSKFIKEAGKEVNNLYWDRIAIKALNSVIQTINNWLGTKIEMLKVPERFIDAENQQKIKETMRGFRQENKPQEELQSSDNPLHKPRS